MFNDAYFINPATDIKTDLYGKYWNGSQEVILQNNSAFATKPQIEIDLTGLKTAIDATLTNRLASVYGVLQSLNDVNSKFFEWRVTIYGTVSVEFIEAFGWPYLYFLLSHTPHEPPTTPGTYIGNQTAT